MGVPFPDDLTSLLLETNGVVDDNGADVVWSCEEIISQNAMFRNGDFDELYMPFDHLLLFGEDGGGDLYAYAILAGSVRLDFNIYRWDHESDSRCVWAYGLERFLTQVLQTGDEEHPGVHDHD